MTLYTPYKWDITVLKGESRSKSVEYGHSLYSTGEGGVKKAVYDCILNFGGTGIVIFGRLHVELCSSMESIREICFLYAFSCGWYFVHYTCILHQMYPFT